MRNLFKKSTVILNVTNGHIKFTKIENTVFGFIHLQSRLENPFTFRDETKISDYPNGFKPDLDFINCEYAVSSNETGNERNTARLVLRENLISIWGVYNPTIEFKGSFFYSV